MRAEILPRFLYNRIFYFSETCNWHDKSTLGPFKISEIVRCSGKCHGMSGRAAVSRHVSCSHRVLIVWLQLGTSTNQSLQALLLCGVQFHGKVLHVQSRDGSYVRVGQQKTNDVSVSHGVVGMHESVGGVLVLLRHRLPSGGFLEHMLQFLWMIHGRIGVHRTGPLGKDYQHHDDEQHDESVPPALRNGVHVVPHTLGASERRLFSVYCTKIMVLFSVFCNIDMRIIH